MKNSPKITPSLSIEPSTKDFAQQQVLSPLLLIKQHKTIALLPQIKPKFKIKPNQLLTKQHLKIKPQLLTIKQNQKTTLKIQRKQQPLTTLIIIQIQLKEQSQKLSLRSKTALLVKSMIAFKNNA